MRRKLFSLIFVFCSCGIDYFIYEEVLPPLKRNQDKALLVFIKTYSLSGKKRAFGKGECKEKTSPVSNSSICGLNSHSFSYPSSINKGLSSGFTGPTSPQPLPNSPNIPYMYMYHRDPPEIFLYIDGNYAGGVDDTTMTRVYVSPGKRLISAIADLNYAVKMHLKEGRIYYIGIRGINIGIGKKPFVKPLTKDTFDIHMERHEYQWSKINPEKERNDLSDKKIKNHKNFWSKYKKKYPDKSQKILDYKGY